jgi:predicted ferric reductase
MQNIVSRIQMQKALAVSGFAVLIWSLFSFPERQLFMRAISSMTIFAFFLLAGQFYCSRRLNEDAPAIAMFSFFKFHNLIGYVCLAVFLLHPFFLVLPKFFDSGIGPAEAFVTMVTTFSSPGIILGITSWILLLIIGLSSYFKSVLPIKYILWRKIHTALASVFIVTAASHVLALSRHANLSVSLFTLALCSCSILFYLSNRPEKTPKLSESK